MIEIIKRAGIFMILAETLIYCCPKTKYEKYLKFIAGVMLLAILIMPVISFIMNIEDKEWVMEPQKMEELLQNMSTDDYVEFLTQYTEELTEEYREQNSMEGEENETINETSHQD